MFLPAQKRNTEHRKHRKKNNNKKVLCICWMNYCVFAWNGEWLQTRINVRKNVAQFNSNLYRNDLHFRSFSVSFSYLCLMLINKKRKFNSEIVTDNNNKRCWILNKHSDGINYHMSFMSFILVSSTLEWEGQNLVSYFDETWTIDISYEIKDEHWTTTQNTCHTRYKFNKHYLIWKHIVHFTRS